MVLNGQFEDVEGEGWTSEGAAVELIELKMPQCALLILVWHLVFGSG